MSPREKREERKEERGERWHQVGGLQGAKGGAMISGLISANVCLVAENPRTALFSAKTISSAFTIPKRSLFSIFTSILFISMIIVTVLFYFFETLNQGPPDVCSMKDIGLIV